MEKPEKSLKVICKISRDKIVVMENNKIFGRIFTPAHTPPKPYTINP